MYVTTVRKYCPKKEKQSQKGKNLSESSVVDVAEDESSDNTDRVLSVADRRPLAYVWYWIQAAPIICVPTWIGLLHMTSLMEEIS